MTEKASANPSSVSVCVTFASGAEVASAMAMPDAFNRSINTCRPFIGTNRPRDSSR